MSDEQWASMAGRIRRFMGRRVRDAHVAEDLAQDVMLKARAALLAGAKQGDDSGEEDEADLAAWVFRIARNTLTDYYRSPRSRDRVPAAGGLEPAYVADDGEPDATRELSACLRPMVVRLSQPYREAVELTEFGGLSQVALAERLGISVSGVKSRVQRGRQQLKAMLLDCCRVETDRGGRPITCDRTPRSDRYCGDGPAK
jgi:RNA polymerase sigma-70 factor, ECF subfamily